MKGPGPNRNQVVPRKQAWATWMCATGTWMFIACLLATAMGGAELIPNDDLVTYGLIGVGVYAFLICPLAWAILRRVPAFRLSHRTHSLQISIWIIGFVALPVVAVVASLTGVF